MRAEALPFHPARPKDEQLFPAAASSAERACFPGQWIALTVVIARFPPLTGLNRPEDAPLYRPPESRLAGLCRASCGLTGRRQRLAPRMELLEARERGYRPCLLLAR